jgi:phage tail protein X
MPTVIAQQNETIDALCHRVLGTTDAVELVYELNQNLADLGPFLPHGTSVEVPAKTTTKTATVQRTSLWD